MFPISRIATARPPSVHRLRRRFRHIACAIAAATGLTMLATLPADAAPSTSAVGVSSPRVTATSDAYQFVGIVEGDVLVVYLDRAADNSPVTTAALDITIGTDTGRAELGKKGTYEVVARILRQPGTHEVLVTITEGPVTDLLVGAVIISAVTSAAHHDTILDHLIQDFPLRTPSVSFASAMVLGAVLAIGVVGILIARSRRSDPSGGLGAVMAIAISTAALALMIAAPDAKAGGDESDGHSHGAVEVAPNGNAPQRRPDGMIYLPKPSQRLLEIRTKAVARETTNPSVRFAGRIVANPNKSGVVQSTMQGRFIAPADGLPSIGASVKAGDLLGRVSPSFISVDASDMTQTLGDLDQRIALSRTKLSRQETLLRSNVVAKAAVDDTRIELEGLLKRRRDLLAARIEPEDLRAPVDGVITAVRVVAGQVVTPADQLLSIVDPSSLMVEALAFDQSNADRLEDAVADVGSDVHSKLKFLGRSRTLQQQYSVLKFEVRDPSPMLNVGTPVIVTARSGDPVTGIVVPRAAIAQAGNGQMVVFKHIEPEVFEPVAIRSEPLDAQSVLVLSGLEPGDKIVVQGAPLVAQVR